MPRDQEARSAKLGVFFASWPVASARAEPCIKTDNGKNVEWPLDKIIDRSRQNEGRQPEADGRRKGYLSPGERNGALARLLPVLEFDVDRETLVEIGGWDVVSHCAKFPSVRRHVVLGPCRSWLRRNAAAECLALSHKSSPTLPGQHRAPHLLAP